MRRGKEEETWWPVIRDRASEVGGRRSDVRVSRLNYKVEGRKESELSGQRSGLKANARFWRLRRQRGRINYVHHALQNRHDDRFMNVESLFQFLF